MSRVTRIKDDWTPWYNGVKAELEKLSRLEIHVGVLGAADGELLKIAYVHEFGARITPKNAKNLAIPLKPSLQHKSPRDIEDAFIIETDGNRFLVRNKGQGELDFLFMLVPSVTIPERSFIRAGYDTNKDLLAEACKKAIERVILGELTAEQAATNIGVAATNMIKRYMRTVQPPKSSLTLLSAPGKTRTLFQSGRLYNSIAFEVTGL